MVGHPMDCTEGKASMGSLAFPLPAIRVVEEEAGAQDPVFQGGEMSPRIMGRKPLKGPSSKGGDADVRGSGSSIKSTPSVVDSAELRETVSRFLFSDWETPCGALTAADSRGHSVNGSTDTRASGCPPASTSSGSSQVEDLLEHLRHLEQRPSGPTSCGPAEAPPPVALAEDVPPEVDKAGSSVVPRDPGNFHSYRSLQEQGASAHEVGVSVQEIVENALADGGAPAADGLIMPEIVAEVSFSDPPSADKSSIQKVKFEDLPRASDDDFAMTLMYLRRGNEGLKLAEVKIVDLAAVGPPSPQKVKAERASRHRRSDRPSDRAGVTAPTTITPLQTPARTASSVGWTEHTEIDSPARIGNNSPNVKRVSAVAGATHSPRDGHSPSSGRTNKKDHSRRMSADGIKLTSKLSQVSPGHRASPDQVWDDMGSVTSISSAPGPLGRPGLKEEAMTWRQLYTESNLKKASINATLTSWQMHSPERALSGSPSGSPDTDSPSYLSRLSKSLSPSSSPEVPIRLTLNGNVNSDVSMMVREREVKDSMMRPSSAAPSPPEHAAYSLVPVPSDLHQSVHRIDSPKHRQESIPAKVVESSHESDTRSSHHHPHHLPAEVASSRVVTDRESEILGHLHGGQRRTLQGSSSMERQRSRSLPSLDEMDPEKYESSQRRISDSFIATTHGSASNHAAKATAPSLSILPSSSSDSRSSSRTDRAERTSSSSSSSSTTAHVSSPVSSATKSKPTAIVVQASTHKAGRGSKTTDSKAVVRDSSRGSTLISSNASRGDPVHWVDPAAAARSEPGQAGGTRVNTRLNRGEGRRQELLREDRVSVGRSATKDRDGKDSRARSGKVSREHGRRGLAVSPPLEMQVETSDLYGAQGLAVPSDRRHVMKQRENGYGWSIALQ